ncbi:hypothetical protein [Aquibacillus rhizosphaerae]|uniref:Uncharacterized protein n=1 Tax=Aquibacillus rhizosphaerae TaxID=3051431 RepID=A0ABT7L7Y9_9BACI|nr:hypothetical protein [Aquibacillus sp. LR5S19]MDL4840711.1 hypothetical protein [Aquibacillus sp. LR5S19]
MTNNKRINNRNKNKKSHPFAEELSDGGERDKVIKNQQKEQAD